MVNNVSGLKIAAAAERAGITVHQARLYAVAQLVKPCAVTAGGHHLYDQEGIARMRLIGAATRAGLPFFQVRRLCLALDERRHAEASAVHAWLQQALDERRSALRRARRLLNAARRDAPARRIARPTQETFR